MVCFSIVPMEKQAINFPKIVQNALKFEMSHISMAMTIQSKENEAPCTEITSLAWRL